MVGGSRKKAIFLFDMLLSLLRSRDTVLVGLQQEYEAPTYDIIYPFFSKRTLQVVTLSGSKRPPEYLHTIEELKKSFVKSIDIVNRLRDLGLKYGPEEEIWT